MNPYLKRQIEEEKGKQELVKEVRVIEENTLVNPGVWAINFSGLADELAVKVVEALPKMQTPSVVLQDECLIKAEKVKSALGVVEMLNLVTEGHKDKKENLKIVFKQLYSVTKYISDSAMFSKECSEHKEWYDNKIPTMKPSSKIWRDYSIVRNEFLKINTKNEEIRENHLELQITNIRKVAPAEFSSVYKELESKLEINQDLQKDVREYCSTCSNTLDSLEGVDELVFLSVCGISLNLINNQDI